MLIYCGVIIIIIIIINNFLTQKKISSFVVLPATRLTQGSYFSISHRCNRSIEYYTCLTPACEEWIRFLRISTKAVHFSARVFYVCKEIGKGEWGSEKCNYISPSYAHTHKVLNKEASFYSQ